MARRDKRQLLLSGRWAVVSKPVRVLRTLAPAGQYQAPRVRAQGTAHRTFTAVINNNYNGRPSGRRCPILRPEPTGNGENSHGREDARRA
ncbi:hypothetical protein VFPFJ_02848 [Purpureocillium lilacinum]|uniref:Uncharacterized protein n=1 Tax=Purpureocillium lilacinum TaxID=33203 RepID=A0A179HT83_PURLI|nr:hypothetical protein VFPFJ_02848 [Purpureocillium lilacinum]OAQ93686.1 hypothetical protein VFPFJ_02848 [Purpureocillium lilacinum]